jgi:hypothetical protein
VNAQTPAIMAALAVVGEAWLAALPDVAAGMAAVDRSLVLDGAVWRPWDEAGRTAFPDGLNLAEALGATFVMRWVHGSAPFIAGSRPDCPLPVLRALLVLRNAAFPPIPFRPRDIVREELQRRIRAMEVAEAPRRPVERLEPYTAPSDIGRNWRS